MAVIKQRIEFLDALRGFAILGVIIAHVGSAAATEGPLRSIIDLGALGVQLFFMVSAFTIFLTYERGVATESMPVRNFFIRRIVRIVPVYWAGILIYTLIYGLQSRGWNAGPELWHYPFNLTLTNIFLVNATSSVVPGGWSISVEVLFYLTMPLWFAVVTSFRRAVVFTVISMSLGWATTQYMPNLVSFPDVTASEANQFWFRQLSSQLACFGFGMVMYFALKDSTVRDRLRTPAVRVGLVALGLIMAASLLAGDRLAVPHHFRACVFFLCAGLFLSQVPVRLLVNDFTRWVGRISYSAYIIHFLIIQSALTWIDLPTNPILKTTVLLVIALAVTLPLAHVSYRYYETAWQRFAKHLVNSSEKRASMESGAQS